jgi:hypothetical protein
VDETLRLIHSIRVSMDEDATCTAPVSAEAGLAG